MREFSDSFASLRLCAQLICHPARNLICAIAIALAGAARLAAADPPAFMVLDASGNSHFYEAKERAGDGFRFADQRVEGTIASIGPDQWELKLTAKMPLSEVWFPWPKQKIEPSAANGAVAYSAELGGLRTKGTTLKDFGWAGAMYPQGCFAPFVIQANERMATLVAAINWPPRPVRPMYCLDRLTLRYEERLSQGQQNSYRALLKRVEGDEAAGRPPWFLAVEEYRAWLTERMRAERLLPIEYPQWLREADGWIYLNLSDMRRFTIAEVEALWNRWRGVVPWMQIWGQMSNYSGPKHLATPPLAAGEECGCCVYNSRMHARYLPDLPEFVRRIAREARIGYYTRPPPEQPRLDRVAADGGPGADQRQLLAWIERNRDEYGGNTIYIDVIGAVYSGDVLTVARLLRDRIPRDTVIEYGVDCYPAAMLLSGSLSRGGQVLPESLAELAPDRQPFPRLGRALFCDRIVFLGGANGDWRWWGRRNAHRAERNAFLLGAKLDVWEGDDDRGGTVNPAVVEIVTARKRVGWWQREPVYRDVLELTDIAPGIEVRRFTGKDREELFVVDNWARRSNPTFRFRGREIRMGSDALMIAVLPAEGP